MFPFAGAVQSRRTIGASFIRRQMQLPFRMPILLVQTVQVFVVQTFTSCYYVYHVLITKCSVM
jgi:hypothetical protein